MKVELKNLGILKQAELELGDLTIICGGNNTGKTYATYALFGFLYFWERTIKFTIPDSIIDELLSEGSINLNLTDYFKNYRQTLEKACQDYSKNLSTIFAASPDKFKDAEFKLDLSINELDILNTTYENRIGSAASTARIFAIQKNLESLELVITLLSEKESNKIQSSIIKDYINGAIIEIIFGKFFPRPFIASAERTGTAIFRKELNFARNRMLEELSKVEKEIDPFELLFKGYEDYALPIKINVDFTRNLETVAKQTSQITENSPEIIADFQEIIGGQYTMTRNDELYFVPRNNKKAKLTMDESSSAVRSLLDIGFYLKHIAQKGDLLMIDEPELNLHPENQRRLARLFAKLVNYGVKVYITTHSDYLVKEFNTLIMLNSDKPHIKKIAEDERYQENELLDARRIQAYIAGIASIKLDGKQRRTSCQTLISADVNQELGIEIKSFDTAIDAMNRIQEAIVWGGEI